MKLIAVALLLFGSSSCRRRNRKSRNGYISFASFPMPSEPRSLENWL